MAASDTDKTAMRVAQNPRFDFLQVEEESILYDTATHNVIYLDPSALVIWRLCDGERSVGEIASLIERAYPQQRDSIADDVRKTVDALANAGALIQRA
jgi:Coenzyme PQQ synthesis protein D (PqqD)